MDLTGSQWRAPFVLVWARSTPQKTHTHIRTHNTVKYMYAHTHTHTHTHTHIPATTPRERDGRVVMNESGGRGRGVEGDKRAVHNDT